MLYWYISKLLSTFASVLFLMPRLRARDEKGIG